MSKRKRVTPEHIQRELAETSQTLPVIAQLADLFTNASMFDSYDSFSDVGFQLAAHAEHKIMAGTHEDVPGYMFKKYNNDRSSKKQIINYMLRIEGARLLRTFITDHGFVHVVAPRKWLFELPDDFPERYLLVVEQLALVAQDESRDNYARIDEDQLRELATILYYFRGLNSSVANLPFTEGGQIAFIDTERWPNNKDFLRKVGDRLSGEDRRIAEDVYAELRDQGAQPFLSAIKRSRRLERAREREREDDDDDDDEDDEEGDTE